MLQWKEIMCTQWKANIFRILNIWLVLEKVGLGVLLVNPKLAWGWFIQNLPRKTQWGNYFNDWPNIDIRVNTHVIITCHGPGSSLRYITTKDAFFTIPSLLHRFFLWSSLLIFLYCLSYSSFTKFRAWSDIESHYCQCSGTGVFHSCMLRMPTN